MKSSSHARIKIVFPGVPPYKSLLSTPEALRSHFHPEHWRDILKSGLQPDTIWAANIFSCPPDRISDILGFNSPGVVSALAFPYSGTEFIRLKVFPTQLDSVGHKIKYLQAKNSGVHLYFTPNFFPRLEEPKPILIVEGEKKALAADQAGHCAVGISGIYGWTKKGSTGLIDDFDLFPLLGRELWIIPDGDFQTNPMVRAGTVGLFTSLKRRGVKASVVDLNLWGRAA